MRSSSAVRACVLAFVVCAVACIAACREPTQLIIHVVTDVNCKDLRNTTVTLGTLGGDIENKPPASVTSACDSAARDIGTVVVVPSGSDDDEVAIKVVAGVHKNAEQCKPPDYTGCIVARRALHYLPHATLTVVIDIDVACQDVPCGALDTCRNGACVSATIPDPAACEDGDGCRLVSLPDGGQTIVTVRPDSGAPDTATAPPVDASIDPKDADAEVAVDATPDSPLDAPIDSPVDAPIDSPVDAPIDSPVDAPIDSPVDAPIDAPIDAVSEAAAPACNPLLAPKDEPCLVTESEGVFVSPSGVDGNAGTRAAPLKTIGNGIALATGTVPPKRVFICAGAYNEQVVIDTFSDGVRMYGGFDCAGWTYNATRPVVTSPLPAYAVRIAGLVVGTTIEDMEFRAAPAVGAGGSSIAAFVSQSQNVVVRRVTFIAGAGILGSAGATATNYVGATAGAGNASTGGNGGAQTVCTCTNAQTSTGGKGGDGSLLAATAGADGLPMLSGGSGGTAGCQPGATGSSTAAGALGGGATSRGAITAISWTPTGGLGGTTASVAQGGGGGGGKILLGGAGGGGGCGGCGGRGGGGAGGGGSSFALISYNSGVLADTVILTAANAGAGGTGGAGQPGQNGGGVGTGAACNGGAGGAGGGGGGGGGGAGGISAAIAYVGTPPIEIALTKNIGTAGAAGPGGAGGNNGTAGVSGAALPTILLP